MEIIGLKEVMEMLGVGKKLATHILNIPGCPVLPRKKNEKFRVPKAAFIEWWEEGGFNEEIQI